MASGFKSLITVNGVPFPDPSEYNATTGTFVDEGRNAMGIVIGAVIRDNVSKVEARWRFVALKTWSDILKLFRKDYGGRFVGTVEFLDQDTGGYIVAEMYVSDRTASAYMRDKDTGKIIGWTDCRIALMEV